MAPASLCKEVMAELIPASAWRVGPFSREERVLGGRGTGLACLEQVSMVTEFEEEGPQSKSHREAEREEKA